MPSNKAIKYSQNVLAIAGLFGLIFISASSVSALNPIVEDESANLNSGKVAGISTSVLNTPLSLSVSSELGRFSVSQMIQPDIDGDLGTVTLSSSPLVKGIYNQDLVDLYNPNNVVSKAQVKFFIPTELKGKLKVYLEDEKDSLIMYTREESYGPKNITLPELSKRDFRVKVEALEDIPSNFQLVFTFAVGQ